jgi:DNA invertase Pin-like site-specific DNA recombinase
MLVDLQDKQDKVETVIIERLDRLARDLMVQENILNDMQKNGVSVISTTEGDLLEDDPTRKLVRQVLGAIAEYDKTMLVLKLKVARDRKRKNGKCEGRKSYQETDPNLIARVKQLRRKPRNGKRMALKKVLEVIQAEGFKTATGEEFTEATMRNLIYITMAR